MAIGVTLTFFVGYRFEIGADWVPYETIFLYINNLSLENAITYVEPTYGLLNWLVGLFGGSLWHVNLICAALFFWALVRLCNILPLPGVAFLAAVPTLIIVVAMSYTRQAGALACIMLAIRAFNGSFHPRWVAWLVLAATFHNSAILVFPIFILAASRNRLVSITVGAGVVLVLLSFFILENAQGLIERYFEGDLQSSGTLPRIGLAIIPALLFFLIKDRKEWLAERYTLWRNLALASMLLIPLLFLVRSTTAVDRIAILFSPLQLLFYSLAPLAFARTKAWQTVIIIGIITLNGLVLAVWLYFAEYSQYWVPYHNVLFERYL
ncbi:MAG TPA: EpsG family protein [Allosphingosinicella sp.]|nr:EpsG family protein [Allosphingosinicella sp.]